MSDPGVTAQLSLPSWASNSSMLTAAPKSLKAVDHLHAVPKTTSMKAANPLEMTPSYPYSLSNMMALSKMALKSSHGGSWVQSGWLRNLLQPTNASAGCELDPPGRLHPE